MTSSHSQSGLVIPLFVVLLSILFICAITPVSGSDPVESDDQDISFVSINLSPGDTKISPGMNITPVITVMNRNITFEEGMVLKYSGTLGPVELISKNSEWPVPISGETKTYTIPFTIPSVQPGIYPLEITLTLNNSGDKSTIMQIKKAPTEIQVTHPKTGSGNSGCGCS